MVKRMHVPTTTGVRIFQQDAYYPREAMRGAPACSASITIEIDVDRIVRAWGSAAVRNKSRRARGMSGAVIVKASNIVEDK